MLFPWNGHAAVLLLVLTRRLILASVEDEKHTVEALSKAIVGSIEVPWINQLDSVVRASESSCAEEIAATSAASNARQLWALQLLDASAKIRSGLISGNIRDLGMYDQCIRASGEYNETKVRGKYCTVSFNLVSSGVCVPSSCNETDVIALADAVVQNVTGISDVAATGASCISVESEGFSTEEILTILFFSIVVAFVIFCTICEFVRNYKTAGVPPVVNELAKFSLYTNAMALLSTEVTPRMMPAIQGMRFFSICWVMLGHRYLNTLLRPVVNTLDIIDWSNSWTAVYVHSAPFAVDTFFVISGFLMSYLFLQSKQSGKKTNFLMTYLHRYLRLTPAIAVLMLFTAVLLHRVGYGPLWKTFSNFYVDRCRTNWWVNLLYVQNIVRADKMCLPHSWYLAADMQLFWLSPFIMYPLYRWPKCGLGILGLLLVGSVVTPAVVLAMNSYSNALLRFELSALQTMTTNFTKYYIPTYNRACAYFVGILVGYDAANKKRHFSKTNAAINWAVSGILILICGLATKRIYDTEFEYDLVLEIIFAVCLRPYWSVAIAWIVYACSFGYGGAVARFLSLPIFLPLSRMSYSMYLVHMILIGIRVGTAQTPDRFADFTVLNHYWGDLVLSIVVAFLFCLFFESPVIVLEKILTNRGPQRSRQPIQKPKTDVEGGIDNKAMTEP